MAARESKRALAEAAGLLGTDSASARGYLRRVQHLAGPVPYEVILAAMRQVPGFDTGQVAGRIAADRTGGTASAPDRPQPADGA